MQPLRILEYLYYICMLLLLFKYCNCALIDLRRHPNHLISESSTDGQLPTTSILDEENRRPVSTSMNLLTETKLKQTIEDCSYTFSWLCLKIEFIQFLDRLMERDEVPLLAGISLVRDIKAKQIKNSEILAGN